MFQKFRSQIVLTVLCFLLASAPPVLAQQVSGERAHGLARNWTNLAGFASQCIDKKLLDQEFGKYARFGSYQGGFVLGSLIADQSTLPQFLNSYVGEGANGRVHEFDTEGNLMAYEIEFTSENCATIGKPLKILFDQFSKAVLEE